MPATANSKVPKQKFTEQDVKDLYRAVENKDLSTAGRLAHAAAGNYKIRTGSNSWRSSPHTSVFSPLKLAIDKHYIDMLALFLPHVDIFAKARGFEHSWFDMALDNSRFDTLKFFIVSTKGFSDPGGYWLRSSVIKKQPEFCALLLPYSDPNERNLDGETALMVAAYWLNFPAVRMLLPVSDANAVDNEGRDALMRAVDGLSDWKWKDDDEESDLECFASLVKACGVERKDAKGMTVAARIAIEHRSAAGVLLGAKTIPAPFAGILFAAGAKLGNGASPSNDQLIRAIETGNSGLVDELLPHSDLNLADEHECTPLLLAAKLGNWNLVSKLAPASDCNRQDAEGRTALMLSVAAGDLDCVRLLAPLTDRALRDKHGKTAAVIAAERLDRHDGKARDVYAFLRVFDPSNAKGQGVLPNLVKFPELFEAALPYCDPNEKDVDGNTALHRAIKDEQDTAFNALLPIADANARGHFGMTPLMLAIDYEKSRMFEALLPLSNARIVSDSGSTALMYATKNSRLHMLRALIPHSDVQAMEKSGVTALMLAAGNGSLAAVSALLPGSNPNAVTNKGKTALMIATDDRKPDAELIKLLASRTDLSIRDIEDKSVVERAQERHGQYEAWLPELLRGMMASDQERQEMEVLIPKPSSTEGGKRKPSIDDRSAKPRGGL